VNFAPTPFAAGAEAAYMASDGACLTAGTFFIAPLNAPRWAWAKNGDVAYQETGTGLNAANPIK